MSDGNPVFVRIPKPDGGPAFAKPAYRGATHEDYESGQDGMSLRDYFAGQALIGWMSSFAGIDSPIDIKRAAAIAYEAADTMLAERSASRTILIERIESEE